MATHPKTVRREPTLAPSRWAALPRRGTVLRLALATVLLALAGGVLYAREPQPTCPAAGTPSRAAAPPDPSSAENPALGDPTPRAGPGLPLPAGTVGVPIRLAEPAALAVVRPGARVDLLAVPATGDPAALRSTEPDLIAARALVLDVVTVDATVATPTALYLALSPEQAQRAIAVPDGTRFAITVR
jgi:hypothetical protein